MAKLTRVVNSAQEFSIFLFVCSFYFVGYYPALCIESKFNYMGNDTIYSISVNGIPGSSNDEDTWTGLEQGEHSVYVDFYKYFGSQLASHLTSLESSATVSGSVDLVQDKILPRCKAFLDLFGIAASKFTSCAITNGRPMRFCERCVADYQITRDRYEEIEKDDYHDTTTGMTCKDLLLNADRIMIIQHAKQFVENLWEKSHCNSCFAHFEYNKTTSAVTFQYDNRTLEFRKRLMQTEKCMNITEDLILSHVNKSACEVCQPDYNDLNEYYSGIEETQKHKVCMDIADAMNMTRLRWSKTFKCTKKHRDVVPVLLLTVFFTFMPVMFYIGSKIHGVREERKIMKQKRMKTVVSSMDSST
ncbi:osteopetrosis-associated transmembrane protein 1 [Lingula anatina]|uniref:Osteopetrosis-associated transmembrane protein 1 n=1 Tax=Lingula anatina TaxID=7574 RepID=A0A1S3HCL3_LINAN|nr:osteopetrosis-associated transmembrane protein 1 [Lingula anatina]|eukprot:XP_013383256.1 osteopetrosis-associated transmembrane protein 1 [Lingula anatina]